MGARAKPSAHDLGQVRLAHEAYTCLDSFLETIRRGIMDKACRQAYAREQGNGPGRMIVEDVVLAAQATVPAALGDLERLLSKEARHARNAS
jgi:hypothetical protein